MKNLFFILFLLISSIAIAQPQPGIDYGFMGVKVDNITAEQMSKLKLKDNKGVIILEVVDNSSAKEAGLKVDDVIIKVKDVPVSNVEQFMKERLKYISGDEIAITFIRTGKTYPLSMKLKPAPKMGQ